jgi:hypothetical protein
MAIEQVHLPDGTTVVIDEWLHYPVFSTIEWAAASGLRLRMFTYIVPNQIPSAGVAKRAATIADTNQVAKGRMNWDEGFRVFSQTYEVFALTNATTTGSSPSQLVAQAPLVSALNLRRLQRDLVISLVVGADIEKPQAREPFAYYHQGVGPVMYTSGDTVGANIAFSAGTGGFVRYASQRRYKLPIKIAPDMPMYVLAEAAFGPVSGLSQDIRLRWYLDGTKRRPLG